MNEIELQPAAYISALEAEVSRLTIENLQLRALGFQLLEGAINEEMDIPSAESADLGTSEDR